VAEGARLESVYTGNRIVGSNPTPSAKPFPEPVLRQQTMPAGAAYFGFLSTEALDSDKLSASKIALSKPIFL